MMLHLNHLVQLNLNDIEKLFNETGFRAQFDLSTGIDEVYQLISSKRINVVDKNDTKFKEFESTFKLDQYKYKKDYYNNTLNLSYLAISSNEGGSGMGLPLSTAIALRKNQGLPCAALPIITASHPVSSNI